MSYIADRLRLCKDNATNNAIQYTRNHRNACFQLIPDDGVVLILRRVIALPLLSKNGSLLSTMASASWRHGQNACAPGTPQRHELTSRSVVFSERVSCGSRANFEVSLVNRILQ